MAVLVTAIPLSSTDFLSAEEDHPEAGIGASSSCCDHVFVARQKHGLAACNEASAADESFRRDFFRMEEKKMIEFTSLVMLFVDRVVRGAE
jgi:hypothetical protein